MYKNTLATPNPGIILFIIATIVFFPEFIFGQSLLSKADNMYSEQNFALGKKIIAIYRQTAQANATNYEAQWKLSRACRWYANQSKIHQVKDWEKECAHYGQMGMRAAKQAFKIKPDGVEGHLYFALCSGSYADGANILTALIQGLKDKIQTHLELAYKINKNYQQGLPVFALGRFWHRLPKALGGDNQKALEYYRQAEKTIPKDSQYRIPLQLFMSELLLEEGQDLDKARQLLEPATNSTIAYYREKAIKLSTNYKN